MTKPVHVTLLFFSIAESVQTSVNFLVLIMFLYYSFLMYPKSLSFTIHLATSKHLRLEF